MNENIIQYQEYLLKQLEKSDIDKLGRFEYLQILSRVCLEYTKMISDDNMVLKDAIKKYIKQYMIDFQKDKSKTPEQEYKTLKENVASYRHTNKRTSKIAQSTLSLTPTSIGEPFPDEDKIEFGKHSSFSQLETYIQDILNTPNNHKEVEKIVKLVSYDNQNTTIGFGSKIRKMTCDVEELRTAFFNVVSHGIEYPEYYLIMADNRGIGVSAGLINCVYKNDTQTFTELLKRGVKTFYDNESLWGLCCAENKKDFLNLMVDYASDDVNYSITRNINLPQYIDRDELGLYIPKNIIYSFVNKTPFDSAIQYNHTDIAERLIHKGYKVNRLYNNCHDSMIYACYKCYPNMIQSLVDFGYNISDRYFKGDTQHHVLTLCHLNEQGFNKKAEFFDCVQVLVHNDVDINAKNENGDTPLHVITKERHYKFHWGNVTQMLCHNAEFMANCYLENGANPNSKDKDGNTPLHLVLSNCIDYQTLPIVANLLKHGAKPDIHNHELVTPYALAFKMLKNAPDAFKKEAQQILKLCQDAKPSLLAKLTRYFSGMKR